MESVPQLDLPEKSFPTRGGRRKQDETVPPSNLLASLSDATLGASYFTAMASHATNATESEWDIQDCEPDLVRITSLESAASTEALLRLFGRKPTTPPPHPPHTFGRKPTIPTSHPFHKLQSSLSARQYCEDSDSLKTRAAYNGAQTLTKSVSQRVPTLLGPSSPVSREAPGLSGPSSPDSRERSGLDANPLESSPRNQACSASSCQAECGGDSESPNHESETNQEVLLRGCNEESLLRGSKEDSLLRGCNEDSLLRGCNEDGLLTGPNQEVLGSTPATPRGGGADDTCPSPTGSVVISAEQRFGDDDVEAAREDQDDPTCSLDPYSWRQQSLESILAASASGGSAAATWQDPQEGQGLSPREILESSILNIISDPAVKARVLSLQLFTGIESFLPPPEASSEASISEAPTAHLPEPRGDEACGVLSDDAEETFDSEGCETPRSPPPLRRTFAAKRENVLDECWLTGAQKRRKAALEPNEDCADAEIDWKRRRF